MFSLRYGGITLHGLRYRVTSTGKDQIIWPRFPVRTQGRTEFRQVVTPMQGVTRHIIAAIKSYLAGEPLKVTRVAPTDTPVETPTQAQASVHSAKIVCPHCEKGVLRRIRGEEQGYGWECDRCHIMQFTFDLLRFYSDRIPPELKPQLEQLLN
jgi:predicted RNA-binding Zn-ribbon protein involved in translation (DUF1610 family)